MLKKFRRFIGHIVGALIVGPIAGVLGGVFLDRGAWYKFNFVTIAAAIVFGAGFLFGFPVLFSFVALGVFGLASFEFNRERQGSNIDQLKAWFKQEKTDRSKVRKSAVTREDVQAKVDELLFTKAVDKQQCVHTPAHSALWYGFTAANLVKRIIAGDEDGVVDGRVYNCTTSVSWAGWWLCSSDGLFNQLGDPSAPPPDAEADGPGLVAGGGAGPTQP